MDEFESLGQYHNFLASVVLSAPANFHPINDEPIDQTAELHRAFALIRDNFHLAKRKIGDPRLYRVAQELVEMSLEAYAAGEEKIGALTLQEGMSMIWGSYESGIKRRPEAELRAFGEVVSYAGARISPYPYEGTLTDLGADQATLLALAIHHVEFYLSKWQDFRFFAWVMEVDGSIKRISPDPKEDIFPVLQPVGRTSSACARRAKTLAQGAQIRACVVMNIMGPQGDGFIRYELEQRGFPLASVRQSFVLGKGPSHTFSTAHVHLEEPEVFALNI